MCDCLSLCVGVFSGRVELFVCGAGVVGLEAAGEVLVSSAPAQGGTGLPPRALAGQTGERALGAQDQVSRTHDSWAVLLKGPCCPAQYTEAS